jgi:hypothetical protein
MDWQGVGVIVAISGLLLTIFANALTFAFFFGKFFAKFDGLVSIFKTFEKSFEKHMDKEDERTEAIWKRIDEQKSIIGTHDTRITVLEQTSR